MNRWTQDHWNDRARQVWDKYEDEDEDRHDIEEYVVSELAEILENEFTDSFPGFGCSDWSDDLTALLSVVKWEEIARGIVDNIKDSIKV